MLSRYAFPIKTDSEIIDLTADEKPFYFNPYSGELSLTFPRQREIAGVGSLRTSAILYPYERP